MLVTMFLRSTMVLFLFSIFSQQVAAANKQEAAACTDNCLRSAYVAIYQTPPYLTAKVRVVGSSNLGRMRGSVVYGNFTTPDDETISSFGWVGTRDAMIRMPLPTEGSVSGEYKFTVLNIAMRGDTAKKYKFDPKGSDMLTATKTIP